MCTVCGCDAGPDAAARPAGGPHGHADHQHPHGHDHAGDLRHTHGLIDAGAGLAGVHVPGLSQERIVRIERDILSRNDTHARANRARLQAAGVLALNLMSGPGAGKTTLLCHLIAALRERMPVAVIEGDQQTSNDAERVRRSGAPAVQINTGKGCHLDAHMVGQALQRLRPAPGSLLLIENVGNLVCPAAFDLGEAHKVVILSVTEGEDKPLKYPDMFRAADLMLLNKTDLLPHLDFDVARALDYARRVHPGLEVLQVSARSGLGLDAWLAWIERAALAVGPAPANEPVPEGTMPPAGQRG